MASPAQQSANRTNAQFSTGPQTAAGKAASSQNAVKHGLSSAEAVILPGEQPLFDELAAGLSASLQPKDTFEEILVAQAVHAAWNMRRCRILEARLAATTQADPLESDSQNAAFDRYRRYYLAAERTFFRAVRVLRPPQSSQGRRTQFLVPAFHVLDPHDPSKSVTMFRPATEEEAAAEPPAPKPPAHEPPPVQNEPNSPASVASPAPHTPRSAPCPCGSGQKFKRCCGVGAAPVLGTAA